jgi:WD40 repeat protein
LRADDPAATQSGDRFVVADGNKLLITKASTGKVLFTGVDDGEVINPRFSPDGKRIVSGCSNGTVKVWLQAAHSAPVVAEAPK